MKNTQILLLLALLSSAFAAGPAWAGYVPVPGSCTSNGLGEDLCSCDLSSSIDGSVVHSDTVQCMTLQCSDFQDATGCGGLQQATCVLRNPYYAGDCTQTVLFEAPQVTSAQQACQEVQVELNTELSSGHGYCNSTPIRGGWALISSALGN